MNLLIDTHTLLWFYKRDSALSATAARLIADPGNAVFVSPASYWELAIKLSTGKLGLTEPYLDFVQHAVFDNGFSILPVEPRHTAALVSLPFHHRDPFDRLLIAQAMVEGMPVVSADPTFDLYPISRQW